MPAFVLQGILSPRGQIDSDTPDYWERRMAVIDKARHRLHHVVPPAIQKLLADPDCAKIFATGNGLNPSAVITGLVHGNAGYGNVAFRNLGNDNAGKEEGIGLRLSLSGFYFKESRITIDPNLFDVGLVETQL